MTEQNHDHTAAFGPEGSAASQEQYQERPRPPRRFHDRDRSRFGRGRRPSGDRRREQPPVLELDPRIAELIRETEEKLAGTYHPVQIENLNPFERKQFHQHFERRKSFYQTKTYRNGENHVLWIFPVANLKKFVEEQAQEAIANGRSVELPPMSNYERFLAHNILKELGTVDSSSSGEGEDRHILIQPKKIEPPNQFGRSLRKIAKKIKLM